MDYLNSIKRIITASGNYLMNREVIADAFYGLLKFLDLQDKKINSKQDQLIAGSNITIIGNTISSSGGGGGGAGTVTSVDLAVPTPASPAYSVSGNPVTAAGTLTINALGNTTQYVRGDGSLAPFPTIPSAVTISGRTGDVITTLSGTNYEVSTVVSPFLLMGA